MLVSARNGAPGARLRPAACLRGQPEPIARMHGQHPSGPDFVSAAGGRRNGRRRESPNRHRRPPLARAGARGPSKNPRTGPGMRVHQQPPCMCDRTCQYRPYTHARAYTKCTHAYVRASRIRFPINIAPGHVPVPGPASAANNPGPGSARPRRPQGLLWQNRVKTAPPKLISSLFFCPLRLLWKKCRLLHPK